jgi:hypothetical protein
MAACLGAIAAWLSGGRADIDTLAWAGLRFTHTSAVRAALARAVSEGRYAPATANKHLAALRGAMKAAWRLGMLETEDYPGDLLDAGADLPAVQQLLGHASPAATALTRADIVGLASPPEVRWRVGSRMVQRCCTPRRQPLPPLDALEVSAV